MPELKPIAQKRAKSNTSKASYLDGVRTFKKHIGRGDIFQGVLSQRFSVSGAISAFDVYRRLRRSNPSPYMYFVRAGELSIAGSSPETLVQKTRNVATTRPIAGTRPRGATPDDDIRNERNLRASVKENAEHIMLVDLGRNDLGRVCRSGTVATVQLREIDRYSHVMHLVSTVSGQTRPNVDSFDVIEAAFPAGTVTGAPKIRAMELIDQTEPERRGVYAGCVGYIDWYDNMDMAIAIRTAVIDKYGGSVQAGAGIVADSDPEREYEETCNKAAAPLLAMGGVIEKL
jgi:anthranilate synthase component 1